MTSYALPQDIVGRSFSPFWLPWRWKSAFKAISSNFFLISPHSNTVRRKRSPPSMPT